MKYTTIMIEQSEGVGIITLNRPKVLNAMNLQLVKDMSSAINNLEADPQIGALIITGSGEKAFSAGADIHEIRTFTPEEARIAGEIRYEKQWLIATCRKPIIGAINGLAYGGGALLASSFDFLVGCERSKFRFLAAAYGQLNATWTLPLTIGWPMAKELLYTGRVVYAEEAQKIGLLNHLVPSNTLLDKAMELGRTIAANYHVSVQGTKSLINEAIGMSWHGMQENEKMARMTTYKGPAVEEGFKDFIARKGRTSR